MAVPAALLLVVALVWWSPLISHSRSRLVASMEFINRIRNWTDDPNLEERGMDVPSRSLRTRQSKNNEQWVPSCPDRKTTAMQTVQTLVTEKVTHRETATTKANNVDDPSAGAVGLQRAVARGDPDASVRLANLYLKGEGVPRSCDQAIEVLQSAAAEANVRARNRLAAMYASGGCVERDRVLAYKWLVSALEADPNNRWAQQNRDLTWQQMTPEERSVADISR